MNSFKRSGLRDSLIIISPLIMVVGFQNCGSYNSLGTMNETSVAVNELPPQDILETAPIPSSPPADIPPVMNGGPGPCPRGTTKIDALKLNVVDTQGFPAIPEANSTFIFYSETESIEITKFYILFEASGYIAVPTEFNLDLYSQIKIFNSTYLIKERSLQRDVLCLPDTESQTF